MNAELARIDKFGRVTIPAKMREAAKLDAGTQVVLRIDPEGRISLEDRRAGLLRARERCKDLPREPSVVEELMAERRQEAEREGF